ncbi:MAG TPA: TetR/AcrR family transcriptional regulator [Acidimicrobiales bacterium]|nr:TetR/AcrR family transcriptional regulator [Acidimicrobiales bacterium]
MGDPVSQVTLPLDGTQRSLVDAAGACLARWGVSKTTVADLANEAGCSRATVYRIFPGGKNQIMAVYGLSELQGFFADASDLVAAADTLEDALVDVIAAAANGLSDHEGFQFMLSHEPGLVLPYLGFTSIDRLYLLATEILAPAFDRFTTEHATQLVEVATRITLSHTFQPSATVDLCDRDDVRRLVTRHLIPICSTPTGSGAADPTATPESATPPLAVAAPVAVPA